MTRRSHWFLVAGTVLLVAPALADEPAPRAWPQALIDRPLLLPLLGVQATVAGGLTNVDNGGFGGNGATFSVGADLGVGGRTQTGFYIAFPIAPLTTFGTVLTNLQISLSRYLNLRFDLGVEHDFHEAGIDTLLLGVGAPFKWKFHRFFALVGGSSSARGFGPPVYLISDATTGGGRHYGTSYPLTDDIVVLGVIHPAFQKTGVAVGFQFPVSLLFQPHEAISLRVRSGLRVRVTHDPNDVSEGSAPPNPIDFFIPLSFELVVSPVRRLDIGATATIAGFVDRSTLMGRSDDFIGSGGYANVRVFELWLAFRP